MSGKSKKIIVTALISCCVIVAGLALLYWYAGHQSRKGTIYATYFSKSVLGLIEDSPVTYKGVPVGSIDKLRIAPDGKLVEVIFRVYSTHVLDKKTVVAQLAPLGYTGGLVLDLDKIKPGEVVKSPKIIFPTEYVVIQSRPRAISAGSGRGFR